MSGSGAWQVSFDRLPPGDPSSSPPLTPHNYQAALNLLECAARALEILYDRRDQLEASLDSVSKQAESALTAAQGKVLDWQKLAAGLKNEVQDLERRLDAMQMRAELAEMQIEGERARAAAAEGRADSAIVLSEGFHSKIVSAFGRGSSAHKALLVAVDASWNA